MKYTDRLLRNKQFLDLQERIAEIEKDRVYCHHELSHSLDVCRIAWILWMEAEQDRIAESGETNHESNKCAGMSAEDREQIKDFFYVTGLLHDIGRVCQYETGADHAEAGVRIAAEILDAIDYPVQRQCEVLEIVKLHTGRVILEEPVHTGAYYIRKADHLSRNCFICPAADTCKWQEDEKNRTVCC